MMVKCYLCKKKVSVPKQYGSKKGFKTICDNCAQKEQKMYLKWLNSKGHSTIKVMCETCKKLFRTVIPTADLTRALGEDMFFCSEKCGNKYNKKEKKRIR